MTVAARSDLLASLHSLREDVQRKVEGLDRYRALKVIERTIADFPTLPELTEPLADIRDRVQQQLAESPEYRASRTLERIMPELSEVLVLIDEPSTTFVPAARALEASSQGGEALVGDEIDRRMTTTSGNPVVPAEEDFQDSGDPAAAVPLSEPRVQPNFTLGDEVDPGEALPAANDAGQPDGSPPLMSSRPSYGIAQFLNTEESTGPVPEPETRADDGLAQFRTAVPHADRAA